MPAKNQQRLIDILEACDLDIDTLADLTRVSPHTVKSWLRPTTSKSHRNMPDGALELLELKLTRNPHQGRIKKQTRQEPENAE